MQVFEGFDKLVKTSLEKWKVPGIGIAIVKNGEVLLADGYGLRDVEQGLPVTSQTLFAIGSSTKAFTTMGMALLVDEGKLEWDKTVREYLPWFRLHDAMASERITLRDLVTHRSGLPRHDMMWYNSGLGREDIIRRLPYLEPSKDFRTFWQYQNIMYLTAGYLSGLSAGLSWEDLIRQRIFEPLGMNSSNFSVDESRKQSDFSLPYRYNYLKEDSESKCIPFRNIDTAGPAGSINSNAEDMAKWLQLHLSSGKLGTTQFVSEANLKQMHSPQMVIQQPSKFPEMPFSCYGMGWFIEPYRGYNMVHHGGNIDGFTALVTFMPEQKLGMVILSNMNGTPIPTVLALSIYDNLLGLEPIDWNERFLGEINKAKKANMEKQEKGSSERRTGTSPSHVISEYVGEFEHPGYGTLEIKLVDDRLQIVYNELVMPLDHYHYDVFEAKYEEFNLTMLTTFGSDLKGNIQTLAIPLEPTLKPIVFERKADEGMRKREFLEQFTGHYRLDPPGLVVSVALKGDNVLTVSIPGQPTYDLEPYQKTTFNLKGTPGFSVEFSRGEDPQVDAIKFVQPNGVFVAKKVS